MSDEIDAALDAYAIDNLDWPEGVALDEHLLKHRSKAVSYTNEELAQWLDELGPCGADERARFDEVARRLRLLDRQEWRCSSCGGVVRFDGTKPPAQAGGG